jgi:triosephosphate isomerase
LPRDVEKAVAAIQTQIQHLYGAKAAKATAILYGGSVTAESAADYLAIDGIDGLLVGGASLDARAFSDIVDKAHKGSGVTKK